MTNHTDRIPLVVTEAGITATFEADKPSSMTWTDRGVICTFDVNGDNTLSVDSKMMAPLACNTPLAGQSMLIYRTDPYEVANFDLPEYMIYDTSDIDDEELGDRLDGVTNTPS